MAKTGKLNKQEEEFILKNVHELTVDEIASGLDRTPAIIEKFIVKNQLKGKDFTDEGYAVLISKLRQRAYYVEIKLQLTADELRYFEDNWVHLMLQFREDVLYSEELSLKQLIILDILMNRSMIERRAHQEDANRLQDMLDDELAKPPDSRDREHLMSLETQLAFARTAITSYTNEHTKLLKERKDIDKSLKTTREQRIKRIEDGKTSFTGWLKSLENEEERRQWGEYAELMRLSMHMARERLMQYHTYGDDKVDIPCLNSESSENANAKDKESA